MVNATVSPNSAAILIQLRLGICSNTSVDGCPSAGYPFSTRPRFVHLEHFAASLSLLQPINRAPNSKQFDHLIISLGIDPWISFDQFHTPSQIYARLPLDRHQPMWWYIGSTIHPPTISRPVPHPEIQPTGTGHRCIFMSQHCGSGMPEEFSINTSFTHYVMLLTSENSEPMNLN